MRAIVSAPDFLKDNYLSTDARIPVTLLRTNACSPLATNAIRDNIWDNFSSETYKTLPAVGQITLHDPYTAERWQYRCRAAGGAHARSLAGEHLVEGAVPPQQPARTLLRRRLG